VATARSNERAVPRASTGHAREPDARLFQA
jgi:hypothetical protein